MHEGDEHTASYYAATANWRTRYPALAGEQACDVCVIGAGFTGVNTAIELAERGFRVVLLEARRVAWGASGRNGGQVIGGFADTARIERAVGAEAARVVWDMGVEGTRILQARVARFDIPCDLKPGYFDAALNRRQMRDLRSYVAKQRERGYPHALTIVERQDVRTVVGSDHYVGGVIDAGNGHCHPLNLCIGEARAAESLGVGIFEQSPVTRVDRGRRVRVHAAAGVVAADYLVVAGNAYLEGLIPELRGYVLPAGSFIIATEPLPEDVWRDLLPQDMAVCDQNVVLDYFRLSADRRLLFGGRCNYSGRTPRSIYGTLVPRMLRVFPRLSGVRIDYEWGGRIAISVNRIPQFGRLSTNIYYVQGYSGHGVVPTHMAARILAEAIAGQAERFDLFARIRHWRLPGGKWFGSPLLALGMLYYRLKDAAANVGG